MIAELWSFLVLQFKSNPAEWVTTLLLLLTLIASLYFERKRIRLAYASDDRTGRTGFWITATNTSFRRSINIVAFGVKKITGEVMEEKHQPVIIGEQLKPQSQEEFTFYDSENGNFLPIDINDILYIYIKDSTGKTYRKYPRNVLTNAFRKFYWWVCRDRGTSGRREDGEKSNHKC